MALTREQILGADDLPREEFQIEKWGGSVFIRHLTMEEALTLNADEPLRIITLAVVDGDGKALFNADDIPALKKKNAKAIEALMKAILTVNGLTDTAAKEAEKN